MIYLCMYLRQLPTYNTQKIILFSPFSHIVKLYQIYKSVIYKYIIEYKCVYMIYIIHENCYDYEMVYMYILSIYRNTNIIVNVILFLIVQRTIICRIEHACFQSCSKHMFLRAVAYSKQLIHKRKIMDVHATLIFMFFLKSGLEL